MGARDADDLGLNTGKAYILERDAGGPGEWGEVAQLFASDFVEYADFGDAVAIDGDTVAVGAPGSDPPGCIPNDCGAVYLFERDQGWSEVAQLVQPYPTEFDAFGTAVAIRDDTLLVGASSAIGTGAAYVFERDAGGAAAWGLTATLLAPDRDQNDRFGYAVAIDGDTAIVGAWRKDCPDGLGDDCGAAYVFERDVGGPGAWGVVAKLVASDAQEEAGFGSAVAIDGDRVVVGAWFEENDDEPGAAYVFGRDAGGPGAWGELARLFPDGHTPGDRFGVSVAVDGDTMVVGADRDRPHGGTERGAAYVFRPLLRAGKEVRGCRLPGAASRVPFTS